MSYKTTCPQCGGNDFYVTPANGVGYCFHCTYYERAGDSGSRKEHVYTHTVEEIRAFYTQATDYYHSCLDSKHVEYLVGRGLSLQTIEASKLGFIPNEPYPYKTEATLLRDSGLYVNQVSILGDRISLPYIVDDIVTDLRGRDFGGDGTVRYKSPVGSGLQRGATYPYNYKDITKPHVVTEGELKALIASQFGIPAVALPGISSWRHHTLSESQQVIVFDSTSNKVTREITYRAIDKLATKLIHPRVAGLPLRGQDKQDLDSFILKAGIEETRLIIDNAPFYQEWAALHRRSFNVH